MIEEHKNFNQFFCPKFDKVTDTEISIFNQFDAVHHKVLNIYLTTCLLTLNPFCEDDASKTEWFDGKEIMLITNSQRIDLSAPEITAPVKEANMYWISMRRDFPVTNRIKL